jgi:hypothetical protein
VSSCLSHIENRFLTTLRYSSAPFRHRNYQRGVSRWSPTTGSQTLCLTERYVRANVLSFPMTTSRSGWVTARYRIPDVKPSHRAPSPHTDTRKLRNSPLVPYVRIFRLLQPYPTSSIPNLAVERPRASALLSFRPSPPPLCSSPPHPETRRSGTQSAGSPPIESFALGEADRSHLGFISSI